MHSFQIRYQNSQGTLMRILSAASRRGLDLSYVKAEPAESAHRATLVMDAGTKHIEQLLRDWAVIPGVFEVRTPVELASAWDQQIARATASIPAATSYNTGVRIASGVPS
jgi:acetolactate synthase small subunit